MRNVSENKHISAVQADIALMLAEATDSSNNNTDNDENNCVELSVTNTHLFCMGYRWCLPPQQQQQQQQQQRHPIPHWVWERYTDLKPKSLSSLNDDVFYGLVRDIHFCLRNYWPILWLILTEVFLVVLVIPFFISPYNVWLFLPACCLTLGLLLKRNTKQIHDLKHEINERIDEWQPFFAKQGYSVQYVIENEALWLLPSKQSYIQISKMDPSTTTTTTLSTMATSTSTTYQLLDLMEEAKFLVLFPRYFRRRNRTVRTIPLIRGQIRYNKPPSLYNFNDQVLEEFLTDLSTCLRVLVRKKMGVYASFILIYCCFVVYFLAAILDYVVVVTLVLFLVGMIVDQFWIDHITLLSGHISTKIEQWKARIEAQGFGIEYVSDDDPPVDFFVWKESYIRIRVLPLWNPRTVSPKF